MTLELTIAVPFHSGLDYLREAIDSVRAQSDPAWSLLVVDDGFEEQGARELVEGLRDARIRYLSNEGNRGMVPTWNRCLDEATTDLVSLLHADDRLLAEYVRLTKRLAGEYPHAVATFCNALIIGSDGRPRRSLQDDIKQLFVPGRRGDVVLHGAAALRSVMRGNFIMCSTLAFRRSLLGPRRFDPSWHQAQDLELTSRLLMEGETLVGGREIAYAYRRHGASATARQTANLVRFEEEYRLYDAVSERARALGWIGAARTSRRKGILKAHLGFRIVTSLVRGRLAAARAAWRFLLRGGQAH